MMARMVGSALERRLLNHFRSLPEAQQETLVDFAAFLVQRRMNDLGEAEMHGLMESADPLHPDPIPRPAEETVIAAIKRLSQTYAMLDRSPMLNETSMLMSAHILQGRAAGEVIDELEALFERHYHVYRTQHRR